MHYRFYEYLLDTETRALTREGEHIEATPKVYRTLVILVENHGRVMTKDELCERIWPGQIVEDANLAQNISSLRRLLQEPQSGRKFIGTFHGVGYRFVAQVQVSEPGSCETQKMPTEIASQSPVEPAQSRTIATGARLLPWLTAALMIVAAIVWLQFRARHGSTLKAVAVQEAPSVIVGTMTRLKGSQYEPAISPDGRQVAFLNIAPNGNESALYLQNLNDLHPRELLSGNGEYLSPAWSPDGKTVAVLQQLPDSLDLLLVPTDGSPPRRLAQLSPHRYGLQYRHIDWSPNGKTIAVDDKTNEADPLTLYLISTTTQYRRRLTFPAMDIIGDLAPRFSPDGRHIAFVRLKYRGEADIYQVSVSGGEATQITSNSSTFSDVGWSTNAELLFTANLDGRFRFYRGRANGAGTPSVAFRGPDAESAIQFSVAGKSVVYSAYSPNLNIWSVSAPLDRKAVPVWTPVIATPADDIGPEISPDGKTLAFRSDYGGFEHLWVSKPDGTDAHMVSAAGPGPLLPAWSADSQSILFSTKKGDGVYRVATLPASIPVKIDGAKLSHPSASVDGRSIFGRRGHTVLQYTPATRELHTITDRGGSPMAQSADGNHLYFSHGRMDTSVTRMELATGNESKVLEDLAPGYRESWALTADGIYYLAEEHHRQYLKFMPLAGGLPRNITPFLGILPPVGASGLSVSASTRTIYVVRGEPIASNLKSFSFF